MHGLRATSLTISILLHAAVLIPLVLLTKSRANNSLRVGPVRQVTLVRVEDAASDALAPLNAADGESLVTARSRAPGLDSRVTAKVERVSIPLYGSESAVHFVPAPTLDARADTRDANSSSLVIASADALQSSVARGSLSRDEPATGFPAATDAPARSVAPAVKHAPPPQYPRAARRRGAEGVVLLEVLVNQVGVPQSVAVKRSSGHAELDAAALTAVRQWTFEPSRAGVVAVAAAVEVPVRFLLNP